MRTLVDIPEKQLKALTRLSKAEKRSRASVIRDAVSAYLENKLFTEKDPAFGAWSDQEIDGLEYQRKIRAEW
ncbi:MAG TPA: ribbon-helix-helix protein, CopG family [Rhizomicrobium sp.]